MTVNIKIARPTLTSRDVKRSMIRQRQIGDAQSVEITVTADQLPSDWTVADGITQDILEVMPDDDEISSFLENFGQFISDHNPKTDQEIWMDGPDKLRARSAYLED